MRNLILAIVSLVCFTGLAGCSGSSNEGGNRGANPTISAVSISGTTATTVTITWATNASANSRVDYGTTPAYGPNVTDPTPVTSHSLTLDSLARHTTYHYKITSVGSAGSAVPRTPR